MLLFTRFWLLLAAIGGAVLPVALGHEASRKRAIIQVVCGAMMAIFLGPAVERRFLPDSPAEIHAGVSFLIGCFGLRLTMIVQRLIDSRGETLANRVIDRIAGADGHE
jgi:acetaldehyde dehydrogenase (acetylating)